ncbi:MAG: hypothetical protein ACK55Z_06510, partial [bacterium]
MFGPGDQPDPSGQSRLNTPLPSPVSVSRTRLSSSARILSGVREVATRGARRFFRFVLARCLPYSCSRKSVQSASDCRIQI